MRPSRARTGRHRVGLSNSAAPPPTTFDDFTEAAYETLLEIAHARFSFESFGTTGDHVHALWRHDVDVSVHRALALARVEARMGVRSTWFLSVHSAFYNLFERDVAARARAILELGHWLGLHFDVSAYEGFEDDDRLHELVDREGRLLEDWLEHPVTAVSFHNPDVVSVPGIRNDRVADLPNAYAASLETGYLYVSDSNGYWRFRRLEDVLVDEDVARLHALTHPEWWQAEPMSPRARLERSAGGRADDALRSYDAALRRFGRVNVR
jgi:hypothetical protein